MELSPTFFAVAGLAVLITGVSKSGFGGGLGVMAAPLMALYVEPSFAVAVMMPILLAMDVLIVASYRRDWDRGAVATLLPGALAGLALGAATFAYFDAALIRIAVGVLAIAFVLQYLIQMLAPQEKSTEFHGFFVFGMGALSGFASYVAHAGGPPVKGFLLFQKYEKSRFVGTNTVFFFTLNLLKTFAYTAFGQISLESLWVSALLSPLLVIGVVAGLRLHRLVEPARFTALVYGFLALAGAKLLWDGVGAL